MGNIDLAVVHSFDMSLPPCLSIAIFPIDLGKNDWAMLGYTAKDTHLSQYSNLHSPGHIVESLS